MTMSRQVYETIDLASAASSHCRVMSVTWMETLHRGLALLAAVDRCVATHLTGIETVSAFESR
jgi:hypothetical protein